MQKRTLNTQFAAILLIVAVTFIGNALFVSALNTETLRTTVESETELFASLLAASISTRVPEEELGTLWDTLPEDFLSAEHSSGVQCWIVDRDGQARLAEDGQVLASLPEDGQARLGEDGQAPASFSADGGGFFQPLPPDVLRSALENGGGTLWLGQRNPFVLWEDCCVVRPLYGGTLFLAAVNHSEPLQALQRRHVTLLLGIDFLLTALMIVLISNLVFKYRREILRYATTDELTGLANRKSFNAAFAEFAASGRPEASLFLLDIDFFKQINDNYGHAAGDHALRFLSERIQAMTRRTGGFAGRWGGDEFIGVLPLPAETAHQALRSLCREIAAAELPDGFRMTISAGVTPMGQETRLAKLSERADLALYQSKEHGRNQASLSDAAPEAGESRPAPGAGTVEEAVVLGEEQVVSRQAASETASPAPEGRRFAERLAGYVRERLISSAILGVRWMAPFVAGGGILIGLAFLFDAASVDLSVLPLDTRASFGSITSIAAVLNALGGTTFNFMLPVFAGFMAYGLAGEDAFMAGFVGGYMTIHSNSGFIGAMAAGFAAGVLTQELRQFTGRLPLFVRKAAPIVVYPVFNLMLMQAVNWAVITPTASAIGSLFSRLLDAVSGSPALTGALSAGMMATDMGGILNKAAYQYGVSGIAAGRTDIMASVMIGGMVPPLGIALSTLLFPGKYTEHERERGAGTLFMGLSFITEGALPYVFTDVFRVIPSCAAGSALAGGLSALLGCTLPAPHGGIFVLPVMGRPVLYLLCLAAGTALSAVLLGMWKRPCGGCDGGAADVPEGQSGNRGGIKPLSFGSGGADTEKKV